MNLTMVEQLCLDLHLKPISIINVLLSGCFVECEAIYIVVYHYVMLLS